MRRIILALCLLLVEALAAAESIVGSWQLLTDSPDGEEYRWTMTVKEAGGELSGTLTGGPGEFPLLEPKFDGERFTCKVRVEQQVYEVQATVSGNKLEGSWKGAGSQGFVKGTRQS